MESVELSCKGGREEERNIKQFITLPVTTCLAFASPNKCHWPTSNALALKSTVCVLTKLYITCHVIIMLGFFFQLWKSCKQWTSEICRELHVPVGNIFLGNRPVLQVKCSLVRSSQAHIHKCQQQFGALLLFFHTSNYDYIMRNI